MMKDWYNIYFSILRNHSPHNTMQKADYIIEAKINND